MWLQAVLLPNPMHGRRAQPHLFGQPAGAPAHRGQAPWPPGANLRHTAPHGATLPAKFLNYFERRFGFKSPSSHFRLHFEFRLRFSERSGQSRGHPTVAPVAGTSPCLTHRSPNSRPGCRSCPGEIEGFIDLESRQRLQPPFRHRKQPNKPYGGALHKRFRKHFRPMQRSDLPVKCSPKAEGLRHAQIAERLNQEGVRRLPGKPWSAETVRKPIKEYGWRCARSARTA